MRVRLQSRPAKAPARSHGTAAAALFRRRHAAWAAAAGTEWIRLNDNP